MAAGVLLQIDTAPFERFRKQLRVFQEPQMTRVLWLAAAAGARALRGPIKAATPVKKRANAGTRGTTRDRRGREIAYGVPGDLRNSVKIARLRRGQGKGGVAYGVGPMGKKAFHRYWVLAGTKPHLIFGRAGHPIASLFGPRAFVKHPGARANPYVRRVQQSQGGLATKAMLRSIERSAAKKTGLR